MENITSRAQEHGVDNDPKPQTQIWFCACRQGKVAKGLSQFNRKKAGLVAFVTIKPLMGMPLVAGTQLVPLRSGLVCRT